MRKLYVYRTTIGSFYIVEHEGKFHPMFSGERLGSYETPQEAAENLAGGHTFSIGGVKDISTLDTVRFNRLEQAWVQTSKRARSA